MSLFDAKKDLQTELNSKIEAKPVDSFFVVKQDE